MEKLNIQMRSASSSKRYYLIFFLLLPLLLFFFQSRTANIKILLYLNIPRIRAEGRYFTMGYEQFLTHPGSRHDPLYVRHSSHSPSFAAFNYEICI